MLYRTPAPNDSTRPIRHNGMCGQRRECWRQSCRDTFSGYATIEVLIAGDAIAYCHRTFTSSFDVKAAMWRESVAP